MSERAGEIVLAVGLGVATAVGVAACSEAPLSQSLNNASVADRYGFDYGDGYFDGQHHSDCLESSAYDLYMPRGSAASLKLEADGTIVITPTTGEAGNLRLNDEGITMPLQPADEQSKGILAAYGCPTGPYEH